MTARDPKSGRAKYSAPIVMDLGELARSQGGCTSGISPQGTCTNGSTLAGTTECKSGNVASTKCARGNTVA